VHVNPMQLVMPPFVAVEPAVAFIRPEPSCTAGGGDVWAMVKENFL
jgi:pyruvate dehydrogenase (quinone)